MNARTQAQTHMHTRMHMNTRTRVCAHAYLYFLFSFVSILIFPHPSPVSRTILCMCVCAESHETASAVYSDTTSTSRGCALHGAPTSSTRACWDAYTYHTTTRCGFAFPLHPMPLTQCLPSKCGVKSTSAARTRMQLPPSLFFLLLYI